MSTAVDDLKVIIRAEISQFQKEMEKAGQTTKRSMDDVKRAVREQTEQARDSVDLLSDSVGVRLPRELKKVIAESRMLAPALSAAFNAAVIVAAAQAMYEVGKKIYDVIEGTRKRAAEAKRAEEAVRVEIGKTMDDIRLSTAEQLELVGAVGEKKLEIETKFARLRRDQARDEFEDYKKKADEYNRILKHLRENPFQPGYVSMDQRARLDQLRANGVSGDGAERTKRLGELEIAAARAESRVQVLEKTLRLPGAGEGAQQVGQLTNALDSLVEAQKRHAEEADKIVRDATRRQMDELSRDLADYGDRVKKFWEEATAAGKSYGEIVEGLRVLQNDFFTDLDRDSGKIKAQTDAAIADMARNAPMPDLGAPSVAMPTFNGAQWQKQAVFLEQWQSQLKATQMVVETLDKSLEGMFLDMITNSRGAGEAFKSFAKGVIAAVAQIIAKMLAMYLVQLLTGLFFGAKTGGQVSAAFGGPSVAPTYSSPVPTALHDWPGDAIAGKPYRVGVPEVILPHGGSAIPLSQFGGKMGGNQVYVDARGSSDPAATEAAVMRGIRKAAPHLIGGSLAAQREQSYRRA